MSRPDQPPNSVKCEIPLQRPDLTRKDLEAVARAVRSRRWTDAAAVEMLEAAWAAAWDGESGDDGESGVSGSMRCVAFATPQALVQALKESLGWQDGAYVVSGPLLHPAWREAFSAAWIRLAYRDLQPESGIQQGEIVAQEGGECGGVVAGMRSYPFGQVAETVAPTSPLRRDDAFTVLDDLSGVVTLDEEGVLPATPSGAHHLRLMLMTGDSPVPVGNLCLVAGRDSIVMERLQRARRQLPSVASTALAISLIRNWPERAARRRALASRYTGLIRTRGLITLPAAVEQRRWPLYPILAADEKMCDALRAFLLRGGVASGAVSGFRMPDVCRDAMLMNHMPGVRHLASHGLLIPLYASLTESRQKRIINRLNRWLQRASS
ncbi:MAG: hypothetical protein HQL50_01330 [Magnetococcales bacterium]|nr:hypothetical protein [Magnetococcales bacterium]